MRQDYRTTTWWDPPEGVDPHTIIAGNLDSLKGETSRRRQQAARDALLQGVDLQAFGIVRNALDEEEPRFNAAENVIDTIVSMTTRERVLPMAITEAGTAEEQERAKEFNRILVGILDEGGAYELDPIVTDDALTSDAGIIKVVERNGRVEFERCFSFEISADPSEGRYGIRRLRTLYQTHAVDRQVLLEQFRDEETGRVPQKIRDAIESATLVDDDQKLYGIERTSDMLVVHEAWHLRSGPRAKDGRYAMCLRDATLVDEKFEHDRFPIVLLYFKPPKAGIWQRSVLSKLAGPQRSFDKVNQKIDECHDILGVPRILMGKGSGIVPAHIDDVPGSFLMCDDVNQIKEWNAQPIHPDAYQFRNQIPDDMLRFFGVSAMSAQSQVPQGLSNASGKALNVFNDAESDRLALFWKQRQDAWVLLAKIALDVARDIGKRNGGYLVTVDDDGERLRVLKLEDFDISASEKKYRVVVQATSFLAKKASAKYQQLSEMRDRGDISPAEFRQHLDMPDILAINELDSAPENLVDRRIGEIFSKGKPFIVEPFHPFATIFERGVKAYDLAQLRDEDEDRLELLRETIRQAKDGMDGKLGMTVAQAAPYPPAAAPPLPPPGPPVPPAGPMPPPGAPAPPGLPMPPTN